MSPELVQKLFGNTEESKSLHLSPNSQNQVGLNLQFLLPNVCRSGATLVIVLLGLLLLKLSVLFWVRGRGQCAPWVVLEGMWAGEGRRSTNCIPPCCLCSAWCICLKPAHMTALHRFLTTLSLGFRNGNLHPWQQCMSFFPRPPPPPRLILYECW